MTHSRRSNPAAAFKNLSPGRRQTRAEWVGIPFTAAAEAGRLTRTSPNPWHSPVKPGFGGRGSGGLADVVLNESFRAHRVLNDSFKTIAGHCDRVPAQPRTAS